MLKGHSFVSKLSCLEKFIPQKGLDYIKHINLELSLPNFKMTYTPTMPAGILYVGNGERGSLTHISCLLYYRVPVAATHEMKAL